MRDLTPIFKLAISQNILWKISEFYAVINLIKQKEFEISHWDTEDNWAAVVRLGKPVGYVWQKYPLLFVESKYVNSMQSIFSATPHLSVIQINDLAEVAFQLDYKNLSDYLDYGVNYEAFSATDLWFITNSI